MQSNELAEILKQVTGEPKAASFDSVHRAIIETAEAHAKFEDPEHAVAQNLFWYLDGLTTAARKQLGVEEAVQEEVPPVKKKRKSNMSVAARKAAGDRMRAMVARKKAEREQLAA